MARSSSGSIDYEAVSLRLRAPRIAIVVPTTDNWRYGASIAINRATKCWGGAGFILIPHVKGEVSDLMLRIAVAFDPDHVVGITDVPIADLLDANACEWDITDGPNEPEELRRLGDPTVPLSPFDDQARVRVSQACAPYRQGRREELDGFDALTSLSATADSTLLRRVELPEIGDVALSVMDSRVRDLALILGERYGIADHPAPSSSDEEMSVDEIRSRTNQEITLGFPVSRSVLRWNADVSNWQSSLQGLVYVSARAGRERAWIVVGSSIEDFSLAYALGRIDGSAQWFPAEWLDSSAELNYFVDEQVSQTIFADHSGIQDIRATSVSLSPESVVEQLTTQRVQDDLLVSGTDAKIVATATSEIGMDHGNGHLALREDFDRDLALPIRYGVEHNSTSFEMVNALPAIAPETPEIRELGRLPTWHIDVECSSSASPTGRGLPWQATQDAHATWPELVRSGRDGYSVVSHSFGFVSGAATLRQSLARPRLAFPGLYEWTSRISAMSGYGISISEAGQRANIAAGLWRGPDAMAESLTRDLPLFMEFMGSGKRSSRERYPEGDGCLIRTDGYLTFNAIGRAKGINVDEEGDLRRLRLAVDDLSIAGVLRRGLILRCLYCQRVQWIPADDLPAPRCGRRLEEVKVSLDTWRAPIAEPEWFYDLHPVVRELLRENGHVPVMASRYLQDQIQRSTALPELDFLKAGRVSFELDLVVGSRAAVVVGECKIHSDIPAAQRKQKLHSLIEGAQALRATEVVVCSADEKGWGESFIGALRDRIQDTRWISGRRPRIHVIDGLTSVPRDEWIDS